MDSFRENRSGGALLHSYLKEEGHSTSLHKGKLDASKRRKINKQLERDGFDGNTRMRSAGQAMDIAAGSLAKLGVEIDEPVMASMFRQTTGQVSLHLAHMISGGDPLRITNSMLFVQWTELRTGYEVVAYVT